MMERVTGFSSQIEFLPSLECKGFVGFLFQSIIHELTNLIWQMEVWKHFLCFQMDKKVVEYRIAYYLSESSDLERKDSFWNQ